jgi:WXG100 family type VII secretion target
MSGRAGSNAMTLPFGLTPEDLHNGANDCRTTSQDIEAQIIQMQAHAQSLVGAYQGISADAFQLVSLEWQKDSTAIKDALEHTAQMLDLTANNYASTSLTNYAQVQRVAATLPAAKF